MARASSASSTVPAYPAACIDRSCMHKSPRYNSSPRHQVEDTDATVFFKTVHGSQLGFCRFEQCITATLSCCQQVTSTSLCTLILTHCQLHSCDTRHSVRLCNYPGQSCPCQHSTTLAQGPPFLQSNPLQVTTPLSKTPPNTPHPPAEIMKFDGPAPELINGRLAMIAFVAAISAEASSHITVFEQFKDASLAVVAFSALIMVASIIPIVRGTDFLDDGGGEGFRPGFNVTNELINGRAAMLGLALLIVYELGAKTPLF
jgi:hypothetical protein